MDLRIILKLHCGNEFLKQVLNFRFTLDDKVPRYVSTIKSSFLGTVGIIRASCLPVGTCSVFQCQIEGEEKVLDHGLIRGTTLADAMHHSDKAVFLM